MVRVEPAQVHHLLWDPLFDREAADALLERLTAAPGDEEAHARLMGMYEPFVLWILRDLEPEAGPHAWHRRHPPPPAPADVLGFHGLRGRRIPEPVGGPSLPVSRIGAAEPVVQPHATAAAIARRAALHARAALARALWWHDHREGRPFEPEAHAAIVRAVSVAFGGTLEETVRIQAVRLESGETRPLPAFRRTGIGAEDWECLLCARMEDDADVPDRIRTAFLYADPGPPDHRVLALWGRVARGDAGSEAAVSLLADAYAGIARAIADRLIAACDGDADPAWFHRTTADALAGAVAAFPAVVSPGRPPPPYSVEDGGAVLTFAEFAAAAMEAALAGGLADLEWVALPVRQRFRAARHAGAVTAAFRVRRSGISVEDLLLGDAPGGFAETARRAALPLRALGVRWSTSRCGAQDGWPYPPTRAGAALLHGLRGLTDDECLELWAMLALVSVPEPLRMLLITRRLPGLGLWLDPEREAMALGRFCPGGRLETSAAAAARALGIPEERLHGLRERARIVAGLPGFDPWAGRSRPVPPDDVA